MHFAFKFFAICFLISVSTLSFSWQVLFNSPPDAGNLKKSLVDLIDSAHMSIHIAIYSVDDEDIIAILKKKIDENVDVRIVMEGENYLKSLKHLYPLDVVADPPTNGLMHSKYVIVDGRYVWCGSSNFTKSSFYKDFNNAVIFDSYELANVFENDFQRMRNGFFSSKENEQTNFLVEGIKVEVRFSPSKDSFDLILDKLKRAKSEIDVAIYSFSDPRIGLFLAYLDQKGVKVRVIADEEWNSSSYSFIPKMKEFDFVKKYKVIDGLLHDKYVIIDPNGSDPVVITGSYNLTLSAERKNSEVVLFIYSKEIALEYLKNFNSIFN
ncbi:phospholipase D-like domain-containing protein [Athalassotoga saccharophila]|uniref:phospholipase D-like domain-containing protein n=1 Tax=Athalassotoga saccharophila TaxID=1441386 RepID=UPI0022B2A214|nr:phospholipase D-like domain-containing protein [Athalassotoga saccharophila]BBJ27352.1 phospholipase D [Athalassotoga saccharophila]